MIKDRLIAMLVKLLLEVLTPDRMQKIINKALDAVEETVEESKNEVDDIVVLPIVNMMRTIVNKV